MDIASYRHRRQAESVSGRVSPRRQAPETCAWDPGSIPGFHLLESRCHPRGAPTAPRGRRPRSVPLASRGGSRRRDPRGSSPWPGPAGSSRPCGPPVRMHRPRHHDGVVCAEAEDVTGPGELGNPETDPGLDLARLEQLPSNVVGRCEELADQSQAIGRPLERRDVAGRWSGRRKHRRDEPVPQQVEVDVGDLAKRVGVAPGESRNLLHRAVEIARHPRPGRPGRRGRTGSGARRRSRHNVRARGRDTQDPYE